MYQDPADESAPEKRHIAVIVWCVCTGLLVGPSLLVWLVRGIAYAGGCAPGAALCHGMTLGAGLRDALNLAWILPNNGFLLIALTVGAGAAAFCEHRTIIGTLSLLLLPMLALSLPSLAVYVTRYPDCHVNPEEIESCLLWGAEMGKSIGTAALVPDIVVALAPTCAALAVMIGLIGWFFAYKSRHRAVRPQQQPVMSMRQFGDHNDDNPFE
jgi:hypothetical protein